MSSLLHPILLNWALDPRFLKDRMCFIAGPRQIGKTTLLQNYLRDCNHPEAYFNWDTASVRQSYHRNPDFFIPSTGKLPTHRALYPVVFDELHKYPQWKSHLKGLYDAWKGRIRFIVTGSARLDFMRKSGDSLVGRYFLFRKLPLHPRECIHSSLPLPTWYPGSPTPDIPFSSSEWMDATSTLLAFNGFPEPFLSGDSHFLTRWQTEHLSLLATEDLSDLTKIEHVLRVEVLAELLRSRVGSPLSTNSLARDLKAAFPTVKRWLDALELVYLTFRIPPYTARLSRAIQKEPKLYFWDWSLPQNEASRFENAIAVWLARAVASWNERGLGRFELYYVRTRDGIEVDFLITSAQKPLILIEVKSSDDRVSPSLRRMKETLKVPTAWQIIRTPGYLRLDRDGTAIMGVDRFLSLLP